VKDSGRKWAKEGFFSSFFPFSRFLTGNLSPGGERLVKDLVKDLKVINN